MLELFWYLEIVNLRTEGLIWRGTYFVQTHGNTTIILPGDTQLRARFHAGRRWPIFGAKLKAWKRKMFHIFSLFGFWYGFENISLNAVAGEKNCLISIPLLLTYSDVSTRQDSAGSFSSLLNPDWSIQISGAPTVCKETLKMYEKLCSKFKCRDCHRDWLNEWRQTDIYLAKSIPFGFLIPPLWPYFIYRKEAMWNYLTYPY